MKVALITGASGGIGGATVKKFIKNGYFVAGQYNRGADRIKKLSEELKAEGLSDFFMPVFCDFNDIEGISSALDKISYNFKYIDALVNNAGAGLYKTLSDTEVKEWEDIFNVNARSAFIFSRYVLKGMIEKKAGKIVNVSSVWGEVGASMEVAYSSSKAALIGFTKALAKEVAPCNINVNCVCPGVIDTPMNARFNGEEMREIKERTPLNRIGSPEEIAELIYFLCSKEADFITGQIIASDGGFSL